MSEPTSREGRMNAGGVCHNCGYHAQYGATVVFLGDYELCFACIQAALDLAEVFANPAQEEATSGGRDGRRKTASTLIGGSRNG
jgi:hypothetical protein